MENRRVLNVKIVVEGGVDTQMEIEIIPEERIKGEMDLNKFEKIMKSTSLDIKKSVSESVSVSKNDIGWDTRRIIDVLIAELDWSVIFLNFRYRISDKLYFKIMPIEFTEKVEYERYAKTENFRKVILKENRKNGTGLILINSLTPSPEHNIDVWIAKSTFPYPESDWKELIVDKL